MACPKFISFFHTVASPEGVDWAGRVHPSFLVVVFIHKQKRCKNGWVYLSELDSILSPPHIFWAGNAPVGKSKQQRWPIGVILKWKKNHSSEGKGPKQPKNIRYQVLTVLIKCYIVNILSVWTLLGGFHNKKGFKNYQILWLDRIYLTF